MPSKSAPTAEPPAEALEPPHSPLASSPAHKHPAQDHVADQADSLPAAPHLDRSAADSATEEAPKPGEPRRESGAGTDRVSSKSISADAELPALTPATTRVKRTLTLTAPSVIKNDTHAPTPAPRSRDASGKRFRSSFLNKSLRRAIEERTTNDSDDDAQDATEDDRRDRTGQTLNALRDKLESVRRASATHGTTFVKHSATDATSERDESPAESALRAPKQEDAPAQPDEHMHERDIGSEHKAEPAAQAEEPATDKAKPSPPRPAAAAPAEQMGAPLSASISAAHPPAHETTRHPLSASVSGPPRARPQPSQLPRSPISRVGHLPSRPGSALAAPTTPTHVRPASSLERAGRGVDSPSRIAQPVAMSPWRKREVGAGAQEKRVRNAEPAGARPGSPGRLRDELLSPFRGGSTRAPSPMTRRVLFGNKSPALSASTPAKTHNAPEHGTGTRARGLFGTQSPLHVSPKAQPRGTTASRPRAVSPSALKSPELPSAARLSAGLDDSDLGMLRPHPAPSEGRSGKIPQLSRSVQSQSASKMRPSVLSSSTSSLASSTPARTRVVPSLRPGSRVSSQPRPQPRPPSAASSARAEDAKRNRPSQPLSEATNQVPAQTQASSMRRVSTEDALKSKLTTQSRPPLPKGTREANGIRTSVARIPSGTRAAHGAPAHTSTLSSTNVFQQQPARGPDTTADELPDVASEYSDSDDEATTKKRKTEPSWTRGRELEEQLLQQATVDPDEIFGIQLGPVPLDAMLPPRKGDRRRLRNRTSSANWNGPDGLAQWEIERYNERMGISGSGPAQPR